MHTNPGPADDLNDLERQLSQWRPSTLDLDADRMLFAAGQNSVRHAWGRRALPIASGCLALLATVLGVGLMHERTARLDLLAQWNGLAPAIVPAPYAVPEPSQTLLAETPAASSYLVARNAVAHNLEAWLDQATIDSAAGPPLPKRAILKANSSGEMLER